MSDEKIRQVLAGQKALVVGVANDQSIAYGCAKAFRTVGAELAITWLNEAGRQFQRGQRPRHQIKNGFPIAIVFAARESSDLRRRMRGERVG